MSSGAFRSQVRFPTPDPDNAAEPSATARPFRRCKPGLRSRNHFHMSSSRFNIVALAALSIDSARALEASAFGPFVVERLDDLSQVQARLARPGCAALLLDADAARGGAVREVADAVA